MCLLPIPSVCDTLSPERIDDIERSLPDIALSGIHPPEPVPNLHRLTLRQLEHLPCCPIFAKRLCGFPHPHGRVHIPMAMTLIQRVGSALLAYAPNSVLLSVGGGQFLPEIRRNARSSIDSKVAVGSSGRCVAQDSLAFPVDYPIPAHPASSV